MDTPDEISAKLEDFAARLKRVEDVQKRVNVALRAVFDSSPDLPIRQEFKFVGPDPNLVTWLEDIAGTITKRTFKDQGMGH